MKYDKNFYLFVFQNNFDGSFALIVMMIMIVQKKLKKKIMMTVMFLTTIIKLLVKSMLIPDDASVTLSMEHILPKS